MTKKDAAWIACGAVLLAGAFWVGLDGDDAGQGSHPTPVEGKSSPPNGKSRAPGDVERPRSRESGSTAPAVRVEPITKAERLVLEGKSSPAQVAAVAKAAALVPQFKQVLQLPAEEAEDRAASLMDEVGDLPVLSEPLVNAMRDVLLSGSPQMVVDYATSGLERQGTPQSAALLADLLHHRNEDIRDSALTALEGMADDHFDTPEVAEKWARNWRLTPQEQAERLEDVVSSVGMPKSTEVTPLPTPPKP